MKAISIKQPWATLIVTQRKENPSLGIKDIENRTWKTKFRGTVLIHASAKRAFEGTFILNLSKEKLNAINNLPAGYLEHFSAIIGTIDIVDCVINHPSIWAEETFIPIEGEGYPQKPIYNWVLENPVKFENPILNVKGKLSFWDYNL